MNPYAFQQLPLAPAQLDNLEQLGYAQMTPIQAQALPVVLEGRDLIAQAQTGSGKTAAFALGLLHKLDAKQFCAQSLVLVPTRELAEQVAVETRRLARSIANVKVLTLVGGSPLPPQASALAAGAQIIIGTPGRVEDHIGKGSLRLESVETLVLDEADRMLDMGFKDAIDAILSHAPEQRQTLLFSATYPDQIRQIAKRVLRDPKLVKVERSLSVSTIEQHFYAVGDETERLKALQLILQQHRPESALVFCATKNDVREVSEQLKCQGHSVLALHGDLEQRERDQVLARFSNKSIPVLVATDVAARGLDIDTLDLVVNYQPARDPEVHVHRVGRTGRAGETGLACTLFSVREARKLAQAVEDFDPDTSSSPLPPRTLLDKPPLRSELRTLVIEGGRKHKIRPGDIVGAITAGGEISGDQLGKINVQTMRSFVAIERGVAKFALAKVGQGKLKGRKYKVRLLSG